MENYFNEMTNKYPVSKTLRFELKPVGNTRETIRRNQILEQDMDIAEVVPRIKKLITGMHKEFIDEVLRSTALSVDLLKEIYGLSFTFGSDERYDEIQVQLRKELSSAFWGHPFFEKMFGKELFSITLPDFAKTEGDLSIISSFEGRTTLFNTYNDEKKRMYNDEKKHFRIPYRLVNENLPRFMNNIRVMELINEKNAYSEEGMRKLGALLGVTELSMFFEPEGFNMVLAQAGIDTYNQLIGGVVTERGKVKGLNEYITLWNQQNPKERKLPLLTQLYKQILSDSSTYSFVINSFGTDEEVLNALNDSNEVLMAQILERTDGMTYQELFRDIDAFDLDGIYVRTAELSIVSSRFCGRWRELEDSFSKMYDASYTGKKKPGTEKYEEEKRKALGKIKERSLAEIVVAFKENPDNSPYFLDWIKNQAVVLVSDTKYRAAVMLEVMGSHRKETPIRQRGKLVGVIKDYLDSIKELWRFLRLFAGGGMNTVRDMSFYAEFNVLKDRFLL